MKIKIFKYRLESSETTIKMPVGSKVLNLGTQNNNPVIWVQLNESIELESRKFLTLLTGHQYDTGNGKTEYIGTYQLSDSHGEYFVGHVFEIKE